MQFQLRVNWLVLAFIEFSGLLGRFKVSQQWLKDEKKKTKALEKKKTKKAPKKKSSSAKTKAPVVDGSNLTSLQDKPLAVKVSGFRTKRSRISR